MSIMDQALTLKDKVSILKHVSIFSEVPEEVNSLVWEFSAAEKAGDAKDRLRITQQVIPAVPVNVQQASFMRVEGAIELPTAVPTGALSGKNGPFGGIEVGLSAKLSTPPPGWISR